MRAVDLHMEPPLCSSTKLTNFLVWAHVPNQQYISRAERCHLSAVAWHLFAAPGDCIFGGCSMAVRPCIICVDFLYPWGFVRRGKRAATPVPHTPAPHTPVTSAVLSLFLHPTSASSQVSLSVCCVIHSVFTHRSFRTTREDVYV